MKRTLLCCLSLLSMAAFVLDSSAKPLASDAAAIQQDQRANVGGVVTDAAGEPLIGVRVSIVGSLRATATDVSGHYNLPDVQLGQKLEFSFIGFVTRVVAVTGATLNQTLEESAQQLDEVVVIGYGTQKKVNLTGAVASVSGKELAGRVQNNIVSSIQGTVPGVTVVTRPNGETSINFRGRGNLGASEPLYVIDGTIASASFFNSLDPNTVESVSFLKDASSAAIYGSRAAYGVVLVTTKQGKRDKMNISYNGYVGLNFPTFVPQNVDSWDYAEMLNEGMWNRNQSSTNRNQAYSDEQIGWFKDGSKPDYYPNTKFFDEIYEPSTVTTRHSLDFSGGTEKLRYFVGLGYLYNPNSGFLRGRSNDRFNFDASINADLKKWVTLNTTAKYVLSNNQADFANPSVRSWSNLSSTMVGRHSDGSLGSMNGGQQASQEYLRNNAYRALDNGSWSNGQASNTLIDVSLDFKPIEGLVIKPQISYTASENKSKNYTPLINDILNFDTKNPISSTGNSVNQMNMAWSQTSRVMYSLLASYDKVFGKHTIGVLVGSTYEDNQYQALSASRKNFPVDGLKDLNAGSNAGADLGNGGGSYQNKMMSYFGRVNYSYDDRYLFEANLRADASSRFHPDNRWGIFPSFSVGWRISQEAFMQDVAWITNLKIRANWGQLGNINNVGNYDYFQRYASDANYSFSDTEVKGIYESSPSNVGLGWETVSMTNVGVDWDMFDGKLGLSVDYYLKETKDILLAYPVADETGISTAPSQNIAKVQNQGVEVVLTHRNTVGEFSYSIGANFAYNANKIIDLGTTGDVIYNVSDKLRAIHRVGAPIGSYYGYRANRTLYSQAEIDAGHYYEAFGRKPNAGDLKWQPNRQNVAWGSEITGEDRVILGNNEPSFTYGVNLSMEYKGFSLSLLGQGVADTKVAIELGQFPFVTNTSPRVDHLDRWTAENPNVNARYPRLYAGHSLDNYNFKNESDLYVFNADYFRLKNLTVAYTFPRSIVKGMEQLRLYVTAENLFTIRHKDLPSDFDPEESAGWTSQGFSTQSVAFGVSLTF